MIELVALLLGVTLGTVAGWWFGGLLADEIEREDP